MLGDVGIERKRPAYREVDEKGEDEAPEDRRLLPPAANQPVNRGGDEHDAEQGLELAPRRPAHARIARTEGMRFHVAVHMEIGGDENQTTVFREGSRKKKRPDQKRSGGPGGRRRENVPGGAED